MSKALCQCGWHARPSGCLPERQAVAGPGCGQGTQRCQRISYFPDCNGADTAGWLFEGKEAGEMGEATADHRLHKAEFGCPCVITGAGGGLDILIGLNKRILKYVPPHTPHANCIFDIEYTKCMFWRVVTIISYKSHEKRKALIEPDPIKRSRPALTLDHSRHIKRVTPDKKHRQTTHSAHHRDCNKDLLRSSTR
jgi:hypothetical protein